MSKTLTIEVAINPEDLADAIIEALVREEGDDIKHEEIEKQIQDDFSSPMILTKFLYDTETMEILAFNE